MREIKGCNAMSHTPDHREDIRSAIREWLRDDVKIKIRMALVSHEDALIDKVLKAVEQAKQDQKKV